MTSQSDKLYTIHYEHRNLPTFFSVLGDYDVHAYYDANGRRILKEIQNGDYEFYVKDGPLTLAVIDQNGFSHFNLIGNGVFGRLEPSGARRYYLKDHLGSTRLVRNNSGTIHGTFDYYPFGLLMPGRTSSYSYTVEKFTGKELDEGLGLYYFGMRYYSAAYGRWPSPDPYASKYPSLSPYNYATNNPLFYIDPNGGLLDDYKVDKKGNISLVKKTDDDFDVLYATDNKGNIDKTKSIKMEKGILNNIKSGEFRGVEYDYMGVNNNKTSTELFEFLAENTGVEWAQVKYGTKSSYISTSHSPSTEAGGVDLLHGLLVNKYTVRAFIHSHPGRKATIYGPSGFDPRDKNSGDRRLAEWIHKYFPNNKRGM